MRRPFLAALGLIAVGALALGACSSSDSSSDPTTTTAAASETIRIGLEGPLTGDQKDTGIGMLRGARLAAQEINAKGGIDGKKVVIVPIDDQADPEVAEVAAKKAIKAGLDAVVGPYNSGAGLKTLPLYIEAGLVPLRLTSSDQTSGLGFTLQPMTSQIAPVATKAITDDFKAKKVGIIFDTTQDYTTAANTAMQTQLKAAGVTITIAEGIEPGAKSYSDTVTKVAATGPDLVYVITYYPEGGLIAKAMYDAKATPKCFADYGAYDPGFITAAGEAAAKACPVVGVPAPDDFPGSAAIIAKYRKAFEAAPGAWSPYTYDSVNLIATVAAETGFEYGALRAGIRNVNGWKGWTGTVAFEEGSGNRVPAPVTVDSVGDDGSYHVDQGWAASVGFAY
ncbi:MAG: branched-chain amino acid ABC transporter substrate-binding protein [Actinomycetes bacterium]